ncbi:MAG TPA: hypothetical protein VKH34_17295 [Vicinamibacterales bacterium]|nr:hypothetical protein [Vicinamibacterales bacterium]
MESVQVVEFVARGSSRDVARAIEQFAQQHGHVSAIVVPWEGTATTLSMSVTSVRADGWAIEHTNLGTITLTDLGDGRTAVAVAGEEPEHAERDRLAAVFNRFALQLHRHFQAGS